MTHLHYLGVLLFVMLCAGFIATAFRPRAPHFWRSFLYVDGVILAMYLTWDYWAISRKNWYFDSRQILNFNVLPRIPVEEVLFFVVVPFTTILTYLALKNLTGWKVGEE
jgi:lycopene cyclase domain-containing protein